MKDYKIPTSTLQNLKSTTLNEDSENPAKKENAEDKERKAKNPAILLSGKQKDYQQDVSNVVFQRSKDGKNCSTPAPHPGVEMSDRSKGSDGILG